MRLEPTAEQETAVDIARSGDSLAVEALAGTGKTTTIELMAAAVKKRTAYVVFNKALAEEAKRKMPSHVRSSTAHSLAFRDVGSRYQHRLNGKRMKSWEIARRLGIEPVVVETKYGRKRLAAGFLAGMVTRSVRRFCQSAEEAIGPEHVPVPNTARDDRELKEAFQEIAEDLPLEEAWADVIDLDGSLPFTHDAYVKIWQLSKPQINADVIYFDEAQDANAVLIDVIEQQRDHAQLCWVGDSRQQIYQWRNAVNALARVEVDTRTWLTHSWRFGKEIADKANEILELLGSEEMLVGRGGPSAVGRVDKPQVILTRTNATAVSLALRAMDGGGQPHVVGGADDVVSFARAARDLQEGRETTHPELACFDDWGDVRAYVASDELGEDLRLLVELIEEFGAERIVSSFSRQPTEARASILLSTAHKSKGREWNRVRLADDFPDSVDRTAKEEFRLLYVAATRARSALDVTSVGMLSVPSARQGPPRGFAPGAMN